MASIIAGYEYDIFISYRQKDNKYDGWVTEFVSNLKKELEATFKEDVSVYFDINPHDGLLETHDVNASLKNKLKCLVFIPVISRTYCDPRSFAWEHEFKAFADLASNDQFGLKVKLSNGNVAGRVLPVRIHDLDNEDIKLCESVLGGVLRGIEFIYKESGFNRPLKPEDDEKINLNKTKYRNQISKVALAIKEIIPGLKAETSSFVNEKIHFTERATGVKEVKNEVKTEIQGNSLKSIRIKFIFGLLITALIVTGIVLIFPKIFKGDTLEKLRLTGGKITVAVMPFQNMTNDTIWNIWQEGIQNELINSLTNSEELMVRQSESISFLLKNKGLKNYASLTPLITNSISKKLDADFSISGTIKQSGTTMRVNAQLTDPKTEEPFKSFQIDGTAGNILSIIDSLSVLVRNSLIITKLEKGLTPDYHLASSTNSAEAFRYYIYGDKAFREEDYTTAVKFYLQALAVDSNFYLASQQLSVAYFNQGLYGGTYEEGKKWCLKLYEKRDKLSLHDRISVNCLYAYIFETPYECITSYKQLLELDDQLPTTYFNLSLNYFILGQNDKAIAESEKAFEIYHKWGSKPWWFHNYTLLGMAYHKAGQYKKEEELYKRAEQDFPNNPRIMKNQTILSLTLGDTVASNKFIKKYITVLKEANWNKSDIISELAIVHTDAGILDKAEEYYSEWLALESENNDVKFLVAFFLIDKERNIDKGLELIDKALKVSPDNYFYLDCKGWGLYKKGKYKEALEMLQRSWDLRRKNGEYDHPAYLRLEEAKRAVAGQKN